MVENEIWGLAEEQGDLYPCHPSKLNFADLSLKFGDLTCRAHDYSESAADCVKSLSPNKVHKLVVELDVHDFDVG